MLGVSLLALGCGGDDGGMMMTMTDGGGGTSDVPGGVGEPANLTGITMMHNQVRAMVDTTGVAGGPLPPMVWDPDLAAHALAYTQMCIDNMAPSGLVDHSPNGTFITLEGAAEVMVKHESYLLRGRGVLSLGEAAKKSRPSGIIAFECC